MSKRILFIVPSLIGGGAERSLINLISHQKNFDEIIICSVLKKGFFLDKIPENIKLITLFRFTFLLKIFTKFHQKFDFLFPIQFLFNLKVKGKFNYGVSYIDGIFTELLNDRIKFDYTISWVHSSYKSDPNFYFYFKNLRYRKRILEKRYSHLNELFFVSNDSKDEFVNIFGDEFKMQVVYNPLDMKLHDISINRKEKKTDKNKFIFLAVGNLIPVKNYDLLIESVKKLSFLEKNFKVVILGDGFKKDILLQKVKSLNLEEFISLEGYVENTFPFYEMSDVFIMTSISEALPTSPIEAMFFGLPLILSNVVGCKEVVENGKYGILCNLNSDSFSSKMYEIMIDSNLYDSYSVLSTKRALFFKQMTSSSLFSSIFSK